MLRRTSTERYVWWSTMLVQPKHGALLTTAIAMRFQQNTIHICCATTWLLSSARGCDGRLAVIHTAVSVPILLLACISLVIFASSSRRSSSLVVGFRDIVLKNTASSESREFANATCFPFATLLLRGGGNDWALGSLNHRREGSRGRRGGGRGKQRDGRLGNTEEVNLPWILASPCSSTAKIRQEEGLAESSQQK